ncbi:LysE family translocator [Saccharospirillum mangrovi]|uniref:LysE family translocator n=1 Tax=Saccharospirillum mangrovi TaxID=2161747 RepID=UPI000D3C67C5|nr:LysE family translocator [Saccharospirillum mangrovi]
MISIEFLFTSLVVVLIPGTGVLYTLATALFQGGRASLYAAAGCTLGIVPSLLASVLGLAVIFHTSVLAFQLIKYVGALYLLYLAWSMWRSTGPMTLADDGAVQTGWSVALKGMLINTLNPKLSIFFLAFMPQFVPADVSQPLPQMLVLGGIFMLMTLVVFIGYGLLAHQLRHWLTQSQRASVVMQKCFAASFAALGVKLALTEHG